MIKQKNEEFIKEFSYEPNIGHETEVGDNF